MSPEIINMLAQFMSRVELKASEIDAYQTCMQELQRAFEGAQEAPPEGSSLGQSNSQEAE